MAPTSDERREVAWMLQWFASLHGNVACVTVERTLNLNYSYGFGGYAVTSESVRRLADLIDPTCETVVKNGRTYCGKCGRMLECEIEDDCYKFTPFCPGCGARVVSGDGK